MSPPIATAQWFISYACLAMGLSGVAAAQSQPQTTHTRGGLPRLATTLRMPDQLDPRAEDGLEVVKIAFLGGSISGGPWKSAVMGWFRSRYPALGFRELAAAVGGTSSEYGAHRLRTDVLRQQPDLIFVEFAVNDDQAGLKDRAMATMEGIVVQARSAPAACDLCFVYFPTRSHLDDYHNGTSPDIVAVHERVAARYGIPSIALGPEIVARIDAGTLVWRGDRGSSPLPFTVDGVHPDKSGNELAASIICGALAGILEQPSANEATEAEPLIAANRWANANLVRPHDAMLENDAWVRETNREGWPKEVLKSTAPAQPLILSFTGGGEVGVKFLRSPRAGNLIVTVDGRSTATASTHGRDGTADWVRLAHMPEGRHEVWLTSGNDERFGDDQPAVRVTEIRFFGILDGFAAGPRAGSSIGRNGGNAAPGQPAR